MASTRKNLEPAKPRRPPATTPEARENQMVALAVGVAEDQLRKGTASSQTISHYLKLGSTRERLEQERLQGENELLRKKIESMDSAKRVEELYETALNAMRAYGGHETAASDEQYDD